MADNFQNGKITTLHNLVDRPIEDLENELMGFAEKRPLGLILPSLYSELEGPALNNIVTELQKVTYLSQIVIGLDKADEGEYFKARDFFARLPHCLLYTSPSPRDRG